MDITAETPLAELPAIFPKDMVDALSQVDGTPPQIPTVDAFIRHMYHNGTHLARATGIESSVFFTVLENLEKIAPEVYQECFRTYTEEMRSHVDFLERHDQENRTTRRST